MVKMRTVVTKMKMEESSALKRQVGELRKSGYKLQRKFKGTKSIHGENPNAK